MVGERLDFVLMPACSWIFTSQMQDDFKIVDRGDVEIKGFDKQGHYFLESENRQAKWRR